MSAYSAPLTRTRNGIVTTFIGGNTSGDSIHAIKQWLKLPILPAVDPAHVQSILCDILVTHRDEIAAAAAHETGSPIAHHLDDIDTALEYISTFALPATSQVRLDPKGRTFINLSANEPIIIAVFMIATGLLTNNRVLVKPSSKSPWVSHFIIKKVYEAGIDASRIAWCYVGPDDMAELIKSKTIDNVISFGSYKVNNTLRAQCAHSQVEFHGESEGNDWVYIDKDIPISLSELVGWLVEGLTRHNGQMCDSIKGLLIHEERYQEISELLMARLDQLIVGGAEAKLTQIATTPVDIYEGMFSSYACTMYADGAKGRMVTNPDGDLMSTPHFGLVAWMRPVEAIDEAIELYDAFNKHGVAFSVISGNHSVTQKTIEYVRAARININANPVDVASSSMWGGVRRSGQGGAFHWWERFTNRKVINE